MSHASEVSRRIRTVKFKLSSTEAECTLVGTLKCSLWNVCSMNNKLPLLIEHLTDSQPDVIFLTETWLTSEKNNITAEVKDYGYHLLHRPRKNREKNRGGGVGILMRTSIKYKKVVK